MKPTITPVRINAAPVAGNPVGPFEIAAPGERVTWFALLAVPAFPNPGGVAECYIAFSHGTDGAKIPIAAGDTYTGDDLAEAGLYAWIFGGDGDVATIWAVSPDACGALSSGVGRVISTL